MILNSLNANPTKWSNTLKQFVGKMPMNFLSVFDHFVGLALEGLTKLGNSASKKIFNLISKLGYTGIQKYEP